MFTKKKTCGVCGYRVTPTKEEIYVAEEPRGFMDALTKPPMRFSAMVCPRCGWEAAEAERRRAYLHEHGLTLCADGLRRLIIPKNGGNEEMKYKVCDHCGAHLDYGETCDCRNTNNDGGEPKDKQKERKNDNDGN